MVQLPSFEELQTGAMLLVDKPLEWTSFDVIKKIRRKIKVKIGHCGTLDPLATGLLICCSGKMTKQIEKYQKQDKEYTGIVQLGARTPTYDLESEPEDFKPYEHITEEQIKNIVQEQFLGNIEQIPPAHSAIKMNGKRVYELARKGEEVKMKPRIVQINEFEITKVNLPEVHFRISCSTGTYIRSIANDLGAALDCGGYLKELRRTKIGDFDVKNAADIDTWMNHIITQDDE